MTVETSAQTLLIQEMGNKTDGAAKNEQTVENTHAKVVFGLFRREGTAVAEEVNEADSNAAINVEDQVVLLGSGDGLNGNGVVEQLVRSKVLLNELLDKLDTEIGVIARLDTVTNTRNELVLLAHGIDELSWGPALVESLGEFLGGTVQSTTKARTNGQETSN